MQASDTFFYFDGSNVIGPHTSAELSELFHAKALTLDTQVCTSNDHGWKPLSQFPQLMSEPAKRQRLVTAVEQQSDAGDMQEVKPGADAQDDVTMGRPGQKDEEEDEESDVIKRFTPIKTVRSLLNDLWEAQRESIISQIKNEELDEKYEKKRKEHLEIKEKVRDLVHEYWRRSGVLDDWINDLIWKGKDGEWGDYLKKLKQGDIHGNFEKVIIWLEESGLGELAGVYSFRNGKKRIYIGQTNLLKKRMKDHEGQYFWGEATHLRILIPQHKASREKLERLMILRHQPEDNGNKGNSVAGSKADEVLDFIIKEINDLLTDG